MKKAILYTIMLLSGFLSYGQGGIDKADSLVQQARYLNQDRKFKQALEKMALAEPLTLNTFGQESIRYADLCYVYGLIQYSYGVYKEAEKWLDLCRAIRLKLLGKEHLDYLRSLYYLGNVYYHMGDNYERAEQCYLEVKAIEEYTVGVNSLEYAGILNALGMLYIRMGNYDTSEKNFLESLKIREQKLGKENIIYSGTLNNLGIVYSAKKKYEEAERFHKSNVEIITKVLGKDNPQYAGGIMNIASVYLKLGKHRDAELLFLESKRILENAADYSKIPSYMSCMEFLGELYYAMEKYDLAEQYHLIAKELRGKELGTEHLSYQMSLANLSLLYWAKKDYVKAVSYLTDAASMRRQLLFNASRHLSEKEVFFYTKYFEQELDQHYSFANDHFAVHPHFTTSCYNNTLFHKGFLLNISQRFRSQNIANTQLPDKLQQIQNHRNQLSAEYALPQAKRNQTKIKEVEGIVNTLEKELSRTVVGYGEVVRQVQWQDVQAALKPGEVALEFLHFNYTNPKPTGKVLYAALLLKPNQHYPIFIPLFDEKALETLMPSLYHLRSEYINQLYQNEAMAKLIWSPLEAHLQGVKTVYYAPSGLLHRINLAALSTGAQGILADRHNFVTLGSTRQMVAPSQLASSPATAALYGAIQYDMDSTAIRPVLVNKNASYRGLDFDQVDSTLRGGTWGFLKYSEKETTQIAAALQKAKISNILHKGYSASEESFKAIGKQSPSPRILHISTHGYFFPDPKTQLDLAAGPAFKHSDHPMIRSGLILAGANHAWQTGRPLGNREDGVLTAYEISQMNLSNTELVVLSACETGLGEIRGDEGVYGLQRAFKSAGAKTLVMSLWQVPDFQTQELMTLFYQKLLNEKLPVHNALRAAQNEMRRKGYEPYYWAGFVMVE
ncbi:CHAT domain-containing protein [Haliscomenobacter hydrossis]|uniref:Tetratricopeptide TPR_1 repeat-containing protein n=1 Tax=Haliscomenobacter hydrossis (strain ATCC 27775 / DSM 1100 / LMG 10767 / O) TaxID=760192 RepID=F4L0D6_HALH1|nr:CHAT domain-containing tetratricopeptide repeat protein [Haliscomenobacter hydrossis]AEE53809.1 Tetratricopeptide TPR_1 repeat-containing protein [Haliscomenobacter hydrossis DSM 1100]